jgi:predicted Zn-dependent protease with MMP-like domain
MTFEETIGHAYDRLPEWVRTKVENVAIVADDVVSDEVVDDMGLASNLDLLGLYQGVPRIDRSVSEGFSLPDTIHIYRLPCELEAKESGKPLESVVYETLWHEIAHHFGLDEDAVEAREREEFGA